MAESSIYIRVVPKIDEEETRHVARDLVRTILDEIRVMFGEFLRSPVGFFRR